MAHNYLVTAHHPTAVTACATGPCPLRRTLILYILTQFRSSLGNFTSEDDLNLVLAKNNLVEVLSVMPEGLRTVKNFHVNGKVEVMKFFRPPVGDIEV